MNKEEALQLAKDGYSSSTTFFDASFRKQMEDALRMFQSKHPLDSKYNSEAYKYRSKLFRPKTRSVIRKNEAAAATAYFANVDVVNVQAPNEKNPQQVISAVMYKELLQYRLTKSIPWFLTSMGAFQDAMTVGVVTSHQYWSFKTRVTKQKAFVMDEMTGQPMMGFDGPIAEDVEDVKVIEDKPVIEIIPVENLRIDPGASWVDPINTSPYLIHMIPMYVGDLKEMAKPNQKTGEPGWDIPDEKALLAATKPSYDSTRQVREGNRQDSKENESRITDFSIVWVHKNIMRRDGEDWCYFTLGVEHALNDPKPLSEYSPLKKRPYTMGIAIIETHKVYPAGLPELGKEVQKEINETANSRQDNVRLVMNKRHIVRRGSQTDLKSLVRNVAGSVTLANDPERDIKVLDYNDVTGSSYQEHDRLNVEMDELLGNFGNASVMSNRKLNETVGGMAMMNQGANQLTEYTLRTFTETWTEPTLAQLVELEKAYETDETVLKLVGDRIGVALTDELFDTDIELTVNVGMGATDPMMKLQKLLSGAKAFAEIASMQAPGLQMLELGKEIFGYIGYRDGGRFINEDQDPRVAQLMGMVQKLQEALGQAQEALENKDALEDAEIKERAVKLQDASKKIAAEIDLIQAQTVKTLEEAAAVPDMVLAKQASSAERPTLQ